jgi:hypothetical protein
MVNVSSKQSDAKTEGRNLPAEKQAKRPNSKSAQIFFDLRGNAKLF